MTKNIEQLRVTLTDVRDGSFAAFEALAEHRRKVEECAGWIPRLDAAQLLEVSTSLVDLIRSLEAHSVKFAVAIDAVLQEITAAAVATPSETVASVISPPPAA